jgi:chemotaxis protein MotB
MGDASAAKKEDMAKLKEDLIKSIEKMANFEKLKQQIELTITPEGLRIEMMEDPKGTFFEPGKAQPTPVLGDLLKILAEETGKLPNNISIEGHTDATPYSSTGTYSNWELSADRANMARRLMESTGLHPGQVVQVRGFADHNLRKPLQPNDASNRRVSVIIQYLAKPGEPDSLFDGSLSGATKVDLGAANAISGK